ncbi:MAG: exonuclease SbcCD subunit D [Bdellovibrio sp.]|nr:exonuclease SbcCD subunit D [Bdellovibrio sp.]
MQTIKILHTSDWHLGKKLFRSSRMEEQKLFLKWLLHTIVEDNVGILLISGDIFDSPIPTVEAQEVYFQFLKDTTEQTACRVFIISGNHDSGRFLEAPLPFLRPSRIEVLGRFRKHLSEHIFLLPVENQKIGLFLLPHFRANDLLLQEQTAQHDSDYECDAFLHQHVLLRALERTVRQAKNLLQQQGANFSILMAHHLFGNTHYAGSELFLGLSGLESIPTSIFSDTFDYLALGHLHGFQTSSTNPLAIYPGSPIPLHFGEDNYKSVSLLEITSKQGQMKSSQSCKAIPPFRMILSVSGQTSELAEKLRHKLQTQVATLPPFIELRSEGGPVLSSDEVRFCDLAKEYDGSILKMSYQTSITDRAEINSSRSPISHDFPTSLNLPQIFQAFHRHKYQGTEPSEALMQTFLNSLDEWSHSSMSPSQLEEKTLNDENQTTNPS